MEITYTLEPSDYSRFNAFVVRRVPALMRQFVLRVLVIPVIVGVELVSLFHAAWLIALPLVVVATALWVAYLIWAQRRLVARQAQYRPGALGLHTMRVGAEDVREQSDALEMVVRWPKITEVTQSDHHVIFLIGPRYGLIVPRRAFGSPDQEQAFVETVRGYRRAALDGIAPVLPQAEGVWPPAPRTMA
jgi:hypothetical protein